MPDVFTRRGRFSACRFRRFEHARARPPGSPGSVGSAETREGDWMKKVALTLVLVPGVLACASLSPEAAQVKVYQAELAERDAVPPALPAGCKLLGDVRTDPAAAGGPRDQRSLPHRAQSDGEPRRQRALRPVVSDRESDEARLSRRGHVSGLHGPFPELVSRHIRVLRVRHAGAPGSRRSAAAFLAERLQVRARQEDAAADARDSARGGGRRRSTAGSCADARASGAGSAGAQRSRRRCSR